MNMDVFVFGIGCSGTTMTYSLLQHIFAKCYGDNFYSTYEPFVWDREKFNLPYSKAAKLFGKTSSLSVEGMYNHVNTPMFVETADRHEYIKNEFFRHFSDSNGPGVPHLAKLIRGNGRMQIFREINPAAGMLLIIRNPVDNINCAKNKFAFFGEDFYPSDFPRFCEQLRKENRLTQDQENANWAHKQSEYCFQMNRAAIDFALLDGKTKIIEYDWFIKNLSSSVADLCDFLDIPFSDDYVNVLQKPTGSVTGSNVLSQTEYETIFDYDAKYQKLCEQAGVTRGKSPADIHCRYNGKCNSKDADPELQQHTTNRLRWAIRAKDEQIRQLKKQLEAIKSLEDKPIISMHNTRLFPRKLGAAKYRISGIAERCDWIVVTDGYPNFDSLIHTTISRKPRTVFLSLRSFFHALPYFYEEVLPKIDSRFILISGSEDFTLPNQVDLRFRPSSSSEKDLVRKIAEDDRVIHWFAENRDEELPKMSSLPLGYLFKDHPTNVVKLTPPDLAINDRPLKALCAHRVREGAQWENRRLVTKLCRESFGGFTTVLEDEITQDAFEQKIREHPFVICVNGGGLDPSPKAWQTIANGSIPIIKSSVLDDAYLQLPVAMVDDWTEDCLCEEKLRSWLDQLAPYYQPGPLRSATLHKLSLDYWWNRILEGRAYGPSQFGTPPNQSAQQIRDRRRVA